MIAPAMLSIALALSAPDDAKGEWRLVWADEFDKPGAPDPSKWTYEEGYVRNREVQYYVAGRKENARVEDGMLIIEARKESFPIPPDKRGKGRRKVEATAEVTSASLTTRGKQNWTHGRIEVRAKLPTGRGTWPAIWMLGDNIREVGWPACGEIDIMENVGFDPDVIHGNIHTRKYNHVRGTNKGSRIVIERPYETFHVYAIEWTPENIDFFVDDQKYFTYANEGTGADVWPFDRPHYLIVNVAIGGTWGGRKGVDDAIFPQKMFVDYVRVYQKKIGSPAPTPAAKEKPARP